MSRQEDTAFQEWKKEIEAKLSTDSARTAFSALASDEAAAKEIFRGGLREADYYRRLNEHNAAVRQHEQEQAGYLAEKAKLVSWFEEEKPKNQKLLEEKRALVARVAAAQTTLKELGLTDEADALASGSMAHVGQGGGGNDAPSSSEREVAELRQKVNMFDKALPQLLAQFGSVINDAARGDWDVDPADIMQHSIQYNVDPKTAFWQLTADERAARAEQDLAEKLKKAREDGRREALTNRESPDGFVPSGPSVIDTLRTGKAPDHRSRVDAAVAAFSEFGG